VTPDLYVHRGCVNLFPKIMSADGECLFSVPYLMGTQLCAIERRDEYYSDYCACVHMYVCVCVHIYSVFSSALCIPIQFYQIVLLHNSLIIRESFSCDTIEWIDDHKGIHCVNAMVSIFLFAICPLVNNHDNIGRDMDDAMSETSHRTGETSEDDMADR
jgi:hypothetical protein